MIFFVTDSFLKLQQAPTEEYFGPQLSVLQEEGVHDFEILWSRDQVLADGALQLRTAILNQGKSCIVIGHGKGALEALECLLRYPETRSRLKKLICLQAPIWGTPVADLLTGHPLARLVTRLWCSFTKTNVKAIEELSEMNRQIYMILNRSEIHKIMKEVEIVTVGSLFDWDHKPESWKDRFARFFHRYVSKHAGENDGLVPLQSTRIGNESHLDLFNVSHLASVLLQGPAELIDLIRKSVATMSLRPSGYLRRDLSALSEENSGRQLDHLSQLEIS